MSNFYDENQDQLHEFNPNESNSMNNNFQRINSELPLGGNNSQYNHAKSNINANNYPRTNKNNDQQFTNAVNSNEEIFRPTSISMKKQMQPSQLAS